mgnify:FL=1
MRNFDANLFRQRANLVAIIAAFLANVLTNLFPFNGLTIGEISNRFFQDVQIIPANYAFAIWGIIYLGLISLAIYQVLPAQRENRRLRRIGYMLVLASIAQIVWVFFFQNLLFPFSLVAMLLILLPLMTIYWQLGIGENQVSRQEKWFLHIPISIYLGWISVATIVNVAIVLYSLGWNGWGISPPIWTAIMLLVAAGIAAIIIKKRVDIAFPCVIIWALVAIAVRQANQTLILATAAGLAFGLGLFLALSIWRRRQA